jgi:hypothetical protein
MAGTSRAVTPMRVVARLRHSTIADGRPLLFSNRPFRVKRFQTIHDCGVNVARGLSLLFGLGTKALVWGFLSQAG